MSKKRHPNECPSCQKSPCQCAGGGGGAADENTKDKNTKDGNVNTEKNVISDIQTNDKPNVFFQKYDNELMMSATPTFIPRPQPLANVHNDVEGIQNNRPAWCTLFAATEKQLMLMPSSNLQQEDYISMGIGMSMSGADE